MAFTKRSHEGWLLIDHRASPGVPGLPEGSAWESATITCAHCQKVVVLNPQRTRERGYCRKCDHYVCDRPECNADCRNFNKHLDQLQEQAFRAERVTPGGIILP